MNSGVIGYLSFDEKLRESAIFLQFNFAIMLQ